MHTLQGTHMQCHFVWASRVTTQRAVVGFTQDEKGIWCICVFGLLVKGRWLLLI